MRNTRRHHSMLMILNMHPASKLWPRKRALLCSPKTEPIIICTAESECGRTRAFEEAHLRLSD